MKYILDILLLTFTSIICAQPTTNNYTVKWVNAENGLKQLLVRNCVADDNGFIWIATELGLYRYDGTTIKQIIEEKYPALSKQRITRLGKDDLTGKIYLEANPEGFQYVIDNNKIEKIDPKKSSKNAIFKFNNFCFTESNPLIKEVKKSPEIESLIKEYSSITSLSASVTTNFLYLPQYEYLLVFDKKGLIKRLENHFSSGLVLMQFGEEVLAITKGKLSLIVEGEIVPKKIKVDAIIQCYLDRKLESLSDIEVFGSKDKNYLKYKGGIYQILYSNGSLTAQFLFKSPADDVSSIYYLEKENIYFICTRTQGIAILKPNHFNTIAFEIGNSNKSINYCYSVAIMPNKNWYCLSGWSFNPKTKESKIDNFLIDFKNLRFILPYKNKFYFQADDNFWDIENHQNNYDFSYPKSKKPNYAGFTGYTYHKGQLYLTDASTIYSLKDNNSVSEVVIGKKFKSNTINGICSVGNNLIIPTIKGVYRYSPDTGKVVVIRLLENVNARYIKPINKNSFWVGCYGEGLYLVEHNKAHKVIDKSIDITTAHAIEEDANGNLWVSTNDGLLRTKKVEALKSILHNEPISCYKYTTEDGLTTNEFNGSGTHPSLHTPEGIIGFASMKGFVWFNPQKLPKHLFKGSIVMDKVIINNKKVISSSSNKYFLPKETGIVTFYFSYGYYYNRENLTVAYRFADQNNWTEIEGNTFQISRYKKGEQQLILRISSHGFDPKSAIYQSFMLDFESQYYETYWFWGIALILLISLIYLAYFLGLQYQRKNEEHLKERINEKTTELQDIVVELEKSKNSVAQSLEEKDILLKEVHHRVKNNLQLIISMLNIQARRDNFTDIYEFLRKGETRISSMALIHQNLYQSDESFNSINFQLYVEDLVSSISQTFDNIEDTIKINVMAQNISINLNTAIPLGLIVNELVTNSLKYAFPKKDKGEINIIVSIKDANVLELIIEDNGIGFDIDKVEKRSFGLELIHLLVNQLNGTIVFENSNTTKFTITFQEINL